MQRQSAEAALVRTTSDRGSCRDAITAPSTRRVTAGRLVSLMRFLRLALQIVLFFLLLSLVVAVASAQTGNVEKVALIAAGAVLVWLASRVRRIGAPVHQA